MGTGKRHMGLALSVSALVHVAVLVAWAAPTPQPVVAAPPLLLFDIQEIAPQPTAPAQVVRPRPEPIPEPIVETEVVPVPKPVVKKIVSPKSVPQPQRVAKVDPPPAVEAKAPTAPNTSAVVRGRYEDLLVAWLEKHKQYPGVAQRRGLQGVTMLQLRLDRNGKVLATDLVRSSHHRLLDDAARRMVASADPMPPVPTEMHGDSFDFTLPVGFELH